MSLGTFRLKASGTAAGLPATADASDRRYGISADVVATLPLSREFAFLARVGVFNFKVQSSASTPSGGSVSNDKPAGNKPDFGVGARYGFNQDIAVQLEYQRFKDTDGSSATGTSDVDLISASLVYRFR